MNKFLLTLIPMLGIMSCTSHEFADADDANRNTAISASYEEYKNSAMDNIGDIMEVLGGGETRSDDEYHVSGRALIERIVAMSPEEVDSLYNIYCNATAEKDYDNAYATAIDLLVENTSAEEVQKLFAFTRAYTECGGCDMEMLEAACLNAPTIIRECMIGSAAEIDAFYAPTTRYGMSYCLEELSRKMIESQVEGEVIDIALSLIPGADVVGACMMVGMDLYGAIKTAHEYEMCCATHVSYLP